MCILPFEAKISEEVMLQFFPEGSEIFPPASVTRRTPEETSLGQINNASTLNFYGDSFEDKLKLIQKNKTVFVYCRSGGRSIKAAKLLLELGQHKVYNLKGGIEAWSQEIDPNLEVA